MKKGLLVLSAALMGLSLVGCGENTPKDNTSPIITAGETITGTVNEAINLLKDVTAVDDVDGDLTNLISITTMPELSVNNGVVTPSETGDYEVTYTVSDKAGNEAKKYTTLTVNPRLADQVEYLRFDFNETEAHPFKVCNEPGTEVSHCIYKGNYQVKGDKVDNERWHIKFEGASKMVKGADYEVTYEFNSSVAGNVAFEVYDGYGFSETDIVKGNNKLTFRFTAGDNKENHGFCLQLGALPEGFIIDFSHIEIKEIIGEDSWESEYQEAFKFTSANTSSAFDNNSEGTLDVSDDKAVLNIARGSDENGVWQTKLNVKAGLDLEKGTKYKISFDIVAEKDIDCFEVLFNNGDVEKGIGALYGQSVKANEKKTIEFITTPDAAKDNLTLVFQLGQANVKGDSNKVTVSNLRVENGKASTKEEKSVGYTFTPKGLGTYNDAATAEGFLYAENNKLIYEMTKIGLVDWHNKMYASRVELESEKIYTITFTAKADKDISCALFLNVCGKWDPRVSETVNLTTQEQTFSYTTPKFSADMAFELLFQFGSEANAQLGDAKVEFSSLVIYAQDVQ